MHVNKTNFHMKGFTLGLTLKQRQNTTQKLPIGFSWLNKKCPAHSHIWIDLIVAVFYTYSDIQ